MRILLTNDDGIHARGIKVMWRALRRFGNVAVVAPLEERSTTGHSLTLHKPLRMLPMGEGFFGVSGTPADCVFLGVREAFKGKLPDLVVSGINRGANLGQDIYYSGTVAGAREACIVGIPAIAVSLAVDFKDTPPEERMNYAAAATITARLIRKLRVRGVFDVPAYTLINLNVPDLPLGRIKGIRAAKMGFRHYSGRILKRKDHRGRDYYWVGGQYTGFRKERDTDCVSVAKGYVSLTPLKLDTTDGEYLDRINRSRFLG